MTGTKILEFLMDSQIYSRLNSKYRYLSPHGVRLLTQGCTLGILYIDDFDLSS